MTKQVIRIQTRYQPDLHQWLKDRAKRNNRSLNGELMEVLKQAKEALTTEQTYYTACHESGIEPIIKTEK